MKLKRFVLAFALCVLLISLAISVSAQTQSRCGSVYKVNPLFQNTKIAPRLAAGDTIEPDTYYTTEDEVIAAIRTGWENRMETIIVGYQGSADVDAMGQNMFANIVAHTGVPTQGDYLRWHYKTYSLSWLQDTATNKTVFTCTMTYLTTAEQEETANAEVAALLDSLNVYTASDYVKVKAIYDHLCGNVKYDTDGLLFGNQIVYTAYSALVRNRAVCQGYANLFYRLALELNVDARLIPGTGNGDRHGWNIVKLGDYYYNLDATWDAEPSPGGGGYGYFLKSPDSFSNHVREAAYETAEFHERYPMDSNNYDPLTDPGPDPTRSGWYYVGRRWFFYRGGVPATGWNWINGKWYYFDNTSSIMLTGWLDLDGTRYYLSQSGAMVTGVVTIENKQHFFDNSGAWQGLAQKDGWSKENGKWYYYKANAKQTGWVQEGKTWYYMNTEGVMQTGWLKSGSTWYYLRASGAMATGWEQVSGKWYYFNANGAMLTGWQKIGTTWYYLQSSGAMQTGWLQLGSTWYYLQPGGAMQTGWLKLGNTWYYLQVSGAMATGSVTIGTKTYHFSTSGACLNP